MFFLTLEPRLVTQEEIAALYSHFQKISSSKSDDGLIDKDEFQAALGLKDRLFVDRIFTLFDENGDAQINFREFLCGLSVFCTRGTFEQKLQCMCLCVLGGFFAHVSKFRLSCTISIETVPLASKSCIRC